MLKNQTDTDFALEEAIRHALEAIEQWNPDSPEFTAAVENLVKLKELRSTSPKERRKPLSPDAVIGAVASLSGILLILNFEKLGPVTSKALSFVTKIK